VLTYKRPVANVLSQVQQVPILPEHIWAKYATGNGKAMTRFSNGAPIVSGGPFILDKYTPKQIALFKRNPASTARSRTSTASGCSSSAPPMR
jgi:peptide/nickel transport system substrate-binding protein